MNGTTYALNLATSVGAARPCARIEVAGFVGMLPMSAAARDWSQNHRNLTTKRSPRRLPPPLM